MSNTGSPHSERMERGGIKTPPCSKTALKRLNSLAFDQLKAKHPEVNPGWLPRPAYKDKKANELTQAIIAWIRLNGGQAERVSTTGRPIDHTKVVTDCLGFRRTIGSVTWIKSSMQRGTADLSATIQGRSVKIEIKIKHDKQSAAQRTYQSQVEASGGLYFIASTFEQFYTWYESTFE